LVGYNFSFRCSVMGRRRVGLFSIKVKISVPQHVSCFQYPNITFLFVPEFATMKFIQTLLPIVLSTTTLAAPTATLDKRATTICGQWDSVVTGTYTVYQDLWNEAQATSGSQCTTVNSLSGTTLAWSTAWTWAGGSNQVKSFANVVVTQSTIKKVSAISTIASTWKWRLDPLSITLWFRI
jgi:hypothetical protein